MESGNESLMPTFILLGDDYVAINFVSRRLRKAKKNFSRENKNKKNCEIPPSSRSHKEA